MKRIFTFLIAFFMMFGVANAQIEYATNPNPVDQAIAITTDTVTLSWDFNENATEWRLVFGTTYFLDETHPQTIATEWSEEMTNEYEVTNLLHNTNYFWRIDQRNETDTLVGVIWGFTTTFNTPIDLEINHTQILAGESIELTWSPVVDRTFRTYYVYRNGQKIAETTPNEIGETGYVDDSLAYNPLGYEYFVTVIYDEGESDPSNFVTVLVSGITELNGYVYEHDGETGIANATVNMIGWNEFGDEQEYTFTTDSTGHYFGEVYAGSYTGTAEHEDYVTAEAPVIGNPIIVTYPEIEEVNYILEYPNYMPCNVVAEYWADNYVRVDWDMCGFEQEIDHYKVYRTLCENEGPYTEENTLLLADVWPVMSYVDVNWPYVEVGNYKWGVAAVYAGREFIEDPQSEIVWSNCLEQTVEEPCLPGAPLNIDIDNEFDRVAIWWEQTIEVVKYNVYRSTDNVEYELVDEVLYHNTNDPYVWNDEPGAGNYYYKVTAVYEDCESESAIDINNPENDYVTITVTGIDEHSIATIYPNPVKSTLTIEQTGMKHISMFNLVGQTVYETNTSDEVVNIDMNDYPRGIYVVRVNNNTYKIVK